MTEKKTDVGTNEQWGFHQGPSREVRLRFVVSHATIATKREGQYMDRPSLAGLTVGAI